MIFTWQPDAGASLAHKPVVNTAKYCEYEQRVARLNADIASWSVKFTRDALPVSAFLRARGGVDSFAWTPPDRFARFLCLPRVEARTPWRGRVCSVGRV